MVDVTFVGFIIVGFVAQLINGSLGMSYGTLSVTFLLFIGTPAVLASSAVHIAKAMTGGVSGVSHWRLGNVDNGLFLGLLISGVTGGIIGAVVLTRLPEGILRPFIAVYLLLTGLNILWQTMREQSIGIVRIRIMPLGAFGGFVDAVGGGGWGPIVTSTLLANGHNPHKSIGSVSFAEAFVAAAVAVTLLFTADHLLIDWHIVFGLMIGGIMAAPLAAYLTGKLPVKGLMGGVGLLVVVLSSSMLVTAFLG